MQYVYVPTWQQAIILPRKQVQYVYVPTWPMGICHAQHSNCYFHVSLMCVHVRVCVHSSVCSWSCWLSLQLISQSLLCAKLKLSTSTTPTLPSGSMHTNSLQQSASSHISRYTYNMHHQTMFNSSYDCTTHLSYAWH